MATTKRSGATRPARPERPTDKARATRRALVALAAEMFATRGYLQTSIRDLAEQASMTTGAVYGHFRSKADLLAAAISMRTATDLEARVVTSGSGPAHVDALRRLAADHPKRRQLRALLVEGAAASHTDVETREQLRDEQLSRLEAWIAGYEAERDDLGIDPSVDLHDAVMVTWAIELGLGVLEAFGIEPKSRRSWGDMSARFGRSLLLPPDEGTPPRRARRGRPNVPLSIEEG